MDKFLSILKVRTRTGIFYGFVLLSVFYALPAYYFTALLALCLGWILIVEWPVLCQRVNYLWLLTPFYPVLPFLALMFLNQTLAVHGYLGMLIIATFVHDTGAYLGGNLFGRHLLCPSISPRKTWEGFFAGMASCGIVLWLFLRNQPISLVGILGLTVAVSVILVLGDLFESKLKRLAGVKDTGTLLPGHGGLLDRFDSLLFIGLASAGVILSNCLLALK